jgi:hypothetical protein
VATRGRQEEKKIIVIQLPNSTNLYDQAARAQGLSQDALKLATTLKLNSVFTQE